MASEPWSTRNLIIIIIDPFVLNSVTRLRDLKNLSDIFCTKIAQILDYLLGYFENIILK